MDFDMVMEEENNQVSATDEDGLTEEEKLRQSVAHLTKLYREIVVRHYFHGQEVKKIADELSLPENTVKSRLRLGRDKLRKELTMEKYEKQSFEPEDLWISSTGYTGLDDQPHSLVNNDKIAMNLLILAYEKPVTIPELPVESYVYQYLMKENEDIVDEYDLHPFTMKVQDIDRTLADKVFAICDYYLQGKTKRYSRHIYDIHKLLSKVPLGEEFKVLVKQVRTARAEMDICPSAASGVNVPRLLMEIIDKEIYKEDYAPITTYFQREPISYDDAIKSVEIIAKSGIFEE